MKPPTIKQCRFCGFENRSGAWHLTCAGDMQEGQCDYWQSGGLLPEVYVDANAQEVDDAEYVPECWQTGEAGVVTAQLVRRGKRRSVRRVRMAVS